MIFEVTYRQLNTAAGAQSKSMEKLSSGLRINRAGDDAAGLAISEKMRGQIRGLDQASKNAQDGISLIQTAEGALNETHDILQRMRELAVQSANDTATTTDRKKIQKEFNQLIDEIDRIGDNTEFNTQKLVDGTFTGKFHIGANENQNITLSITSMKSNNLGTKAEYSSTNAVGAVGSLDFAATNGKVTIGNTTVELTDDYSNNMEGLAAKLNAAFSQTEGVTVTAQGGNLIYKGATDFGTPTYADGTTGTGGGALLGTANAAANSTPGGALLSTLKDTALGGTAGVQTQAGANSAITAVNNAIEKVSAERSKLGAYQNRLEHSINNLNTSSENLTAAESRIRDVDMAKEMMNQTKNSILSQAAQAMLAQSNQMPQGVLQLLR
nr:flagellin [Heyndrickxia sporothermodurans]